jgi:hypothetical protein
VGSPIIVSDANILIDFDEGGLLVELFALDAVLAVPDIVYAEELEHLPNLRQEKLRILALGSAAVQDVTRLAQVYRKPNVRHREVGARRAAPRLPGGRVTRRMGEVASTARICCFFSSLKTLLIPGVEDHGPDALVNVPNAATTGRFSGAHNWPVLPAH